MIRLFLTGMLMGLADLIPGISGGTVAFLAGIYDRFIGALKSLKFSSLKGVQWSVLLPLGGGILLALLAFSHLLSFLLGSYQTALYAFLFGLIAAGCFSYFRRIEKRSYLWIAVGLILGFLIAGVHKTLPMEPSLLWLVIGGALASMAMLLPGISGSYVLHVLGIYPLVVLALSRPTEKVSLYILGAIAFGIAIGISLFSRLIDRLINRFRTQSLSLLLGLMAGGMRSLWPFQGGVTPLSLSLTISGFIFLFVIDLRSKKAAV